MLQLYFWKDQEISKEHLIYCLVSYKKPFCRFVLYFIHIQPYRSVDTEGINPHPCDMWEVHTFIYFIVCNHYDNPPLILNFCLRNCTHSKFVSVILQCFSQANAVEECTEVLVALAQRGSAVLDPKTTWLPILQCLLSLQSHGIFVFNVFFLIKFNFI